MKNVYVQHVPRPGEGAHSFQSPRGLRTTILELRTSHPPQSPAQPSGTLSTPLPSTSTAWLRDPKGHGGPDAGPCSSCQEQHFSREPPPQGPPTRLPQNRLPATDVTWPGSIQGSPAGFLLLNQDFPCVAFPRLWPQPTLSRKVPYCPPGQMRCPRAPFQ